MDRAPRRSSSLPRRRPPRAAFSLVEVIVALTIVGILAAISVPKMYDIGNQNRIHRAAQGLQMEAQQAFAVSARNRAPVTLRWNAGASELQLTSLTGATIYRRRAMSGYGLLASEVAVTPAVFTVFPNGIAKDSLIMTIARGAHRKSIHVSRAGMVRIK